MLGVQYDNMFNPAVPSLIPFRWTQATGLVLLQKSDGRVFAWKKADPLGPLRSSTHWPSFRTSMTPMRLPCGPSAGARLGLSFWPGYNQSEIDAVSLVRHQAVRSELQATDWRRKERRQSRVLGTYRLSIRLADQPSSLPAAPIRTGLDSFECRWIGNV